MQSSLSQSGFASRWSRQAAAALVAACATAHLPTASAGPASDNCTLHQRKAASAFVTWMLRREAAGERLLELQGRTDGPPRYYTKVLQTPDSDPAGDIVFLPRRYRLSDVRCAPVGFSSASAEPTIEVEVRLLPGWIFDRDSWEEAEGRQQSYLVQRVGGELRLVPPLPAPFVTPAGARRVIGPPPYASVRLRELKARLGGDSAED